MIKSNALILICISFRVCNTQLPEDTEVGFVTLGAKYGCKVDEHQVVTEDQYILRLFRVRGDPNRPVLLVHGIIDSADTFMVRGNSSLVTALVTRGYDVWALNVRGNRYSRSHRHLDPDNDKRYWDYSFHEMGYYDLPATIDHILGITEQQKLSAIGHSQGNTIFYVLGSTRPEYNEKIKVMIALAPICFLEHVKPPVSDLISSLPILDQLLQLLGMEEVFSDNSLLRRIFQSLCSDSAFYNICAYGLFFPIGGSDPEEFEPSFVPILLRHYPSSTSRKNGVHVGQVAMQKRFAPYDYGFEVNLAVYNASIPPPYDLKKVTMKVAMFVGRNDGISSVRDSENLRDNLPNVDYKLMKYNRLNHLDYVWGRNMKKYLFPYIFSTLKAYS